MTSLTTTMNFSVTLSTTQPTTTLSVYHKILLEDGSSFDDHFMTAVKAGLYCFIFIIGIFGNILVVKATKQYMTLQGATNILICNLCVCDIVMLVLGVPAFVVGEHRLKDWLGTLACRIINPLAIATITATVYTLVAIAVERCNVIVNSRRFKVNLTSHRSYYVIIIIDILAAVSSAPLALIEYRSSSVHCLRAWDVRDNMVYTITLFMFQYVLPLIVMVILYAMCWHRIRKKNKATIKLANNNRMRGAKRSQSDDNILNLAIGEKDNGQDQPNKIISKPRPVSGDFLHNNNNNEINDFLSGSQNHLSGIKRHSWQRKAVMRRSISVDSIILDSSDSIDNNKKERRRNSGCRKSATYDAQLSVVGMLSGDDDGDGTESLSRRRSFVGSMQRLHASFTSLIIGADGQDALTAFAMKRVKQTLKTLRMFSFLVLVFAVCFLPHHVNSFIFEDVHDAVRFTEILIYVSAAINPWIYAGMNKSYRVAFAGFFQEQRHQQRKNRRLNNKFNRQRNMAVYSRNGRRRNIKSNSKHNSNNKTMLKDTTSCSSCDNRLVKFITWFCYKFSSSKGQYNIQAYHHYDEVKSSARRTGGSNNPCELESLNNNNNVVEERETISDLDQFDQFGRRTNSFNTASNVTMSSRKDSKMSRKASSNSTMISTDAAEANHHHHIPVLAPIIIITNYEEELAMQRALEKARETVGGDEDVDEDRFSAIISFNDA